MKKRVSIFVAGALKLKTERYALKALVHELNTRYHEKHIDVHIGMKSFDDFKYNQGVYNNYITQNADMVLFVMDGCVGDYTKNEFKIAVEAYKQKQIPEIVVFLKKYQEETDGIKEVQELLREGFGENYYYIIYENEADLRRKAETRIANFISPENYIRNVGKWRMIAISIAIASLLFIGAIFAFMQYAEKKEAMRPFSSDEKILLFFGGGSVYKYLEDKFDIIVDSLGNIHNSIYVPVPTGNLWYMIAEEYFRDWKEARFNPIYLAANSINVHELKSGIFNEDISDKMLILELFIGQDTTVTHIGNKALEELNFDEDELYQTEKRGGKIIYYQDVNQLRKLVSTAFEKKKLYTTTPKSGTLKSYQNAFDLIKDADLKYNLVDSLIKDSACLMHNVYNEHHIIDNNHVDSHSYVLLGSLHYYPKIRMANNECIDMKKAERNKMLYIKTDSGYLTKDLYVYMIAYKTKDKEDECYIIPTQVKGFLKLLDAKVNSKNQCIQDSVWGKIINYGKFKKSDVHYYDTTGIVTLEIVNKRRKRAK